MTTEQEYPYALDIAVMFVAVQLGPISPFAIAAALTLTVARRSGLVVGAVLDLVAQITGSVVIPDTPAIRKLLPGLENVPQVKPRRQLASGAGASAAATSAVQQQAGQPGAGISLADVASADNVLIVGPKGSGKTTLLNSLIATRRGAHLALDPHATPGKWPCSTVGGGLEYSDIARVLASAYSTMRNRYQGLAQGKVTIEQCRQRSYSIVADEYRSIAKALPRTKNQVGASDILLDLLTQGRKAGIYALIASHSDTVKSLGIEGEGDLRDCFDWIVYLGASATRKLPEAGQMTRPAVAYYPERDEYRLLDTRVNTSVHAPSQHIDDQSVLASLLDPGEPVANGANDSERSATRSPRSPAVQPRSGERANDTERSQTLTTESDERATGDDIVPTGDELRKLVIALQVYQECGSKQRSIEQAFSCRKGSSRAWRRASALFDLAVSAHDDTEGGQEPDIGPFGKYLQE